MTMVAAARSYSPMSSIGSSDFCLIASQAAIDLDNLLLGKRTNLSSVKELVQILKTHTGSPGALTLVSHAMNESDYSPRPKTVAELVEQASTVVGDLEQANSSAVPNISKLRHFCAALSEYSACNLQRVYSSRARHPFRR